MVRRRGHVTVPNANSPSGPKSKRKRSSHSADSQTTEEEHCSEMEEVNPSSVPSSSRRRALSDDHLQGPSKNDVMEVDNGDSTPTTSPSREENPPAAQNSATAAGLEGAGGFKAPAPAVPSSIGPSSVADSEDPPRYENLDISLDSITGEPRQERVVEDLLEVFIPPPPKLVMASDGSGSRLMITKIVNENFKSYYGRHEIGPFHKNFTSIVGPNGSGKSNVIDSLLFVFGYRAQKIRSKKVSVLIHNSEGHEEVSSCSVEVHFQLIIDKPDDEFDVVPGSAFYVTRTAFKDNSSHYMLNGRKMQFKEVGKKLAEHGIDLVHNRFLILQGEVEQIALMKPKAPTEGEEGMLEYLEDIVGSSRLKQPIEQLSQKVDELNELRTEKLNRVRASEKDKEELEKPKNEAIAFLEEENKLIRAKSRLFQLYRKEASDATRKVEAEYEEVKKEYEEKRKELEVVKEQVAESEKRVKKMKKEAEEKQAESDTKKSDFNELDKRDVKAKADIKNKKSKITQAEKSLAAEEKKLVQLKEQPGKSEKEVGEQKEIQEKCEKKIEELQERLEVGMKEVGKQTEPFQQKKQEKEEELMERKKAVNEAKAEADLAQNDLDMYLRGKNAEQSKLDKLKHQKSAREEELKSNQEKLESAERQIPAKQEIVAELRRKIRQLEEEEQKLAGEVSDKRTRAVEARSNMQQARSRGKVLDTLLAAKNKGEIPGIYGRLGDLGAIDEKFDVAISTCCGPLDNIVVDTVDTATDCVSLLKRTEAGQATFICLDKQERLKADMGRPIEIPRNAERIFDLIRVQNDDVLPAFYWALRDTLVAPTLEEATKIAYGAKRWRVVTLKGELIDVSGTMSGGGNRQSRGRMGRQVAESPSGVTAEQLAGMEERVTELTGKLVRVRREKQEAEDELNKAEKLLAEIRPQGENARKLIVKLEDQLKRDEKLIEEQAKKLKEAAPDEAQTEEKQRAVERSNGVLKEVQEAATGLEQQVKEIDGEINEIIDGLVGMTKKSLESAKAEQKKAQKAIVQAGAAATKATREIEKCEGRMEGFNQEISEAQEEIKRLKEDMVEIEQEAMNLMSTMAALDNEKKAIVAGIEEVLEEKKAKEEEAQELERRDLELKTEKENKEEMLKEATKKRDHWQKEHKKLKLHDLREYQDLKQKKIRRKDRKDSENKQENQEEMNCTEVEEQGMEVEECHSGEEDQEDEVGEDGELKLKEYSEEKIEEKIRIEEWVKDKLQYECTTLEAATSVQRPNLRVLEEYKRRELKYLGCVKEMDEVSERRDAHRDKHDELKKMRMNEFMLGFGVISTRLKEMYQMITLGGDAELELVDTMDPFLEGIQFSVRPPKKSWKQISNLSGGEKTLSSLALVFALHHYKPTPLYVMDEIDAALDFKNVSIVANYIKERTKNGQFVIISLRNNMFELADRLVGIYKTYNCTKHVVINPAAIALGPAEYDQ